VPILTLHQVSLAFGHLPLIADADLQIEAGERIAVIGRNGAGKSSVLRVISGETPPDTGTVWRAPALRTARLDQDVPGAAGRTVFEEIASGLGELGALVSRYHEAAVAVASENVRLRDDASAGQVRLRDDASAGQVRRRDDASPDPGLERLGALQHELEQRDGWRLEQKVEMVISRLSLPADRPLRELSGGWRRRALLGKALVSEPHVLLLDEPTNHLDIEAIQWLEEYLKTYPGAILFVTHDRAFLTALATRIIEIDRGRLVSWPGRYAEYLEKKEAALENEARELERLDKKLAKEESWLRRGVKARRTRNEGRVRDLMALRAKRAAYRSEPGTVRLAVDDSASSGRVVFEAEDVSKSLGGVPVIRGYSQRILKGDRVGLIGANGSGKTTLLRLLVGELEPDAGTIRRGTRLQTAYFDQQRQQLDPDATVADIVNDGNTTIVINGRPRHVAGYLEDFLFPRERVMSPVRTLSGGERNRLMLARLFAKPANVLVLDEPTNDLDIETLELLEELIAGFDGTVLLVSHDRVFVEHIVTSTLAFEGEGRVVEYVGGWEDYLRQCRAGLQPRVQPRDPERRESGTGSNDALGRGAKGPRHTDRRSRKLSYNEQREFDTLPSRIEAIETEQQALKSEIEAPDFYKAGADRIKLVMERIEQAAREHDVLLARWMELEERS
jgi:ATP-binding cassette subfamily F protein uup